MKISMKTLGMVIVLLIAFFENWLLTVIPHLGYFDEIIALLAFMFFVTSRKAFHNQKYAPLLAISSVLVLWGLFCNVLSKIQPHPMAIVEDILSNFKFVFIYLGIVEYLRRKGVNTKAVLKTVLPLIKMFMGILFVLACANLVTDIGMSSEVRYGFRGFSYTYGAAGHVINQCTCFLVLLLAENELLGRKNTIWKLMCLFTMVATLKTRALVLVAVYIALYYFFIIRKKRRLGLEVGVIGIVVFLIGYSAFETYFLLNERAPRAMFVDGAIKIVRQYFPFGTGFGTFGSSAAGHYYSSLYYLLGFSNRWGMTPDNQLFINDNYLPMIFAEFGLIMGIVFCVLIYRYSRNVLTDEKYSMSPRVKIATWFFLGNVLLSSIQSSYLASYTVVVFSIFFFLFFYPNKFEQRHV